MIRRNADIDLYFSLNYFQNYVKLNPQHCAIAIVSKGNTPISTEFLLLSKDTIYSYLGGTNADFFNCRPNDFLKVSGVTNDGGSPNIRTATLAWEPGSSSSLDSLSDVEVADNSLFIGTAPGNNSAASYNVSVGITALDAITSGGYNVALGYASATALTDGSSNVMIGYQAGLATTSAVNTVLIGNLAGYDVITSAASGTVAIGAQSAASLLSGQYNTFIGYYSGNAVNTGSKHTVVGYEALDAETSGSGSTAVGYQALSAQNVASANSGNAYNTAVGDRAGDEIVTGYHNTLIGALTATDPSATDGINRISIGYAATCNANNQCTIGSGITAIRANTDTIIDVSDQRDKTNVSDLTEGLDFVNSLRPVKFTWQKRVLEVGDEHFPDNGSDSIGFLAQELQSAMPNGENSYINLVYEVNPERLEVGKTKLIPILVKAIKDLKAQNDALAARVTALESA